VRFLFRTLPFTAEEDDNLERPAQEQEKQRTTMILTAWLKNKKSGARWRSWAPESTTRRAAHDDDWLRVPSRPQELNDHVSSGGQASSYDKSDWWFSATINRNSIDDYLIIWVSP
jgi:hypothetical protein